MQCIQDPECIANNFDTKTKKPLSNEIRDEDLHIVCMDKVKNVFNSMCTFTFML